MLSGLLTVIVGRAVFGAKITVAEAWQRARGRLLALFGITALEALGAALLVAVVVGVVVGIAVRRQAASPRWSSECSWRWVLVVLLTYLGTMLSFAPTLIVLERLGIVARDHAVLRPGEERLLAGVRHPVSRRARRERDRGRRVGTLQHRRRSPVVCKAVHARGRGGTDTDLRSEAAIGQIITAPFNAGVVVLLYTDRRIRAEAFDLVLQTRCDDAAGFAVDATDRL